jgi:hypothetical protein
MRKCGGEARKFSDGGRKDIMCGTGTAVCQLGVTLLICTTTWGHCITHPATIMKPLIVSHNLQGDTVRASICGEGSYQR